MAENFLTIFKTECIYRYKPASSEETNRIIGQYIHFYDHEHI